MNLFVVGPQAFSDWILRMIEDTKDELLALTPPIDVKVRPDVESCDAVIYEGDQQQEHLTQEGYTHLPRLRVAEPGYEISPDPRETLLFRAAREDDPEWLKARFYEAIRTVFLQCHLQALRKTLSGPFSHDVRGALSVVSLARQLLESGGDGQLVAGRLGRVDSRIAMALFDIEARSLCLSGAWPPAVDDTSTSAPRVEEVLDWFSLTQSDRQLETTAAFLDEVRGAPAWVSIALAGCIDGVARLTQGNVELTKKSREGCSFSVSIQAEISDSDEAQLSRLAEPERWPLLASHVVPYRIGTAALLMSAARGSVHGRVEAGKFIVEMQLP